MDAALRGDDSRSRGATFKAKIDLVESMGSEIYAHFSVTSDKSIESDELRELAEDSGAGEVPGGGQEADIFIDASHIQLFDPSDGSSLTADVRKPA